MSESRLYRQTAEHTGDTAVAGVLDELDRVLLDISHAPSQVSRRRSWKACASGWRPKAFFQDPGAGIQRPATRKNRPSPGACTNHEE